MVTKTRIRAGLAFTHRRLRRYNLSTPMAHQRHNPSALHDPKVSIVIPVYNEKSTIDEILRRGLDAEGRKEVIIVDDCSTGGTRQILEKNAARPGDGEEISPAPDGSGKNEVRELR